MDLDVINSFLKRIKKKIYFIKMNFSLFWIKLGFGSCFEEKRER
jgi:hypothetical protein